MELFIALAGIGLGYLLGSSKREIEQASEIEHFEATDTNSEKVTEVQEEK